MLIKKQGRAGGSKSNFVGEGVVGLFADFLFGEANEACLVKVADEEFFVVGWALGLLRWFA